MLYQQIHTNCGPNFVVLTQTKHNQSWSEQHLSKGYRIWQFYPYFLFPLNSQGKQTLFHFLHAMGMCGAKGHGPRKELGREDPEFQAKNYSYPSSIGPHYTKSTQPLHKIHTVRGSAVRVWVQLLGDVQRLKGSVGFLWNSFLTHYSDETGVWQVLVQ